MVGDPVVVNTAWVTSDLDEAAFVLKNHGSVILIPGGPFFMRGDCNGDGAFNLVDAIFGLIYLFDDGDKPTCEDGCDSDDNGVIALVDSLTILTRLFLNGEDPEPPFPTCGGDPTVSDELECETTDGCS